MGNNLHSSEHDDAWMNASKETCDADIEIFIMRKDKQACMMERELDIPPLYVSMMLAALLGFPKMSIKKITVCVDGAKLA